MIYSGSDFFTVFLFAPPSYVILIKPLAAHASVIRNESAFMGPKMGECISDEFRLGPQKKSNKYELEFTAQIGNYFLLFAKSPHYFCLICCFFSINNIFTFVYFIFKKFSESCLSGSYWFIVLNFILVRYEVKRKLAKLITYLFLSLTMTQQMLKASFLFQLILDETLSYGMRK